VLAVASLSRHWQCCKICLCVCVCVLWIHRITLYELLWHGDIIIIHLNTHYTRKEAAVLWLCLWIWCRFHCTFFCEAFPWSAPSELNCWWSISCHTNTTFSHFVRSEWVKPLPCPPTCCWVLLYVHRNHRFIRDGSPGWPHQLSHSSWALRINIRSLVNVI